MSDIVNNIMIKDSDRLIKIIMFLVMLSFVGYLIYQFITMTNLGMTSITYTNTSTLNMSSDTSSWSRGW